MSENKHTDSVNRLYKFFIDFIAENLLISPRKLL